MIADIVLPSLMAAGACASYWFFLRGEMQAWPRVARWLYAGTRARFFALWCLRATVLFAGVALVELALLRRLGAVVTMPTVFAPARALVVRDLGDGGDLPLALLLGGLVTGGVIGGLVDRFRRGRKPWMLGDIRQVMPRHRGELIWGAALSIVAGVSEELFFRLLVPLVVTLVTGQALVGFAVGVVLFAGAHRYQGWAGVGATAFVGVLMTALYLMTGALWVVMLIHVVIDLNGLVLRPIMAGALRVSPSDASRF